MQTTFNFATGGTDNWSGNEMWLYTSTEFTVKSISVKAKSTLTQEQIVQGGISTIALKFINNTTGATYITEAKDVGVNEEYISFSLDFTVEEFQQLIITDIMTNCRNYLGWETTVFMCGWTGSATIGRSHCFDCKLTLEYNATWTIDSQNDGYPYPINTNPTKFTEFTKDRDGYPTNLSVWKLDENNESYPWITGFALIRREVLMKFINDTALNNLVQKINSIFRINSHNNIEHTDLNVRLFQGDKIILKKNNENRPYFESNAEGNSNILKYGKIVYLTNNQIEKNYSTFTIHSDGGFTFRTCKNNKYKGSIKNTNNMLTLDNTSLYIDGSLYVDRQNSGIDSRGHAHFGVTNTHMIYGSNSKGRYDYDKLSIYGYGNSICFLQTYNNNIYYGNTLMQGDFFNSFFNEKINIKSNFISMSDATNNIQFVLRNNTASQGSNFRQGQEVGFKITNENIKTIHNHPMHSQFLLTQDTQWFNSQKSNCISLVSNLLTSGGNNITQEVEYSFTMGAGGSWGGGSVVSILSASSGWQSIKMQIPKKKENNYHPTQYGNLTGITILYGLADNYAQLGYGDISYIKCFSTGDTVLYGTKVYYNAATANDEIATIGNISTALSGYIPNAGNTITGNLTLSRSGNIGITSTGGDVGIISNSGDILIKQTVGSWTKSITIECENSDKININFNGIKIENHNGVSVDAGQYDSDTLRLTGSSGEIIDLTNGDITIDANDDQDIKIATVNSGQTAYYKGTTADNEIATIGDITSRIQESDAMQYKGSINASADLPTVSNTTNNVKVGATYKVATAGNYSYYNGTSTVTQACKVGDLFIAKAIASSTTKTITWDYIPAADDVLSLRYITSGTPTISTTAQTGTNLTLGSAVTKMFETTLTNTDANVPTSKAVQTYVSGGYISNAGNSDTSIDLTISRDGINLNANSLIDISVTDMSLLELDGDGGLVFFDKTSGTPLKTAFQLRYSPSNNDLIYQMFEHDANGSLIGNANTISELKAEVETLSNAMYNGVIRYTFKTFAINSEDIDIYCYDGTRLSLEFENCTFNWNTSNYLAFSGGNCTFTNCRFNGDNPSTGYSLDMTREYADNFYFSNCTFSSCAIYVADNNGFYHFNNCIFDRSTGKVDIGVNINSGNAISNNQSTIEFINCTMGTTNINVGNTVTNYIGAVSIVGCFMTNGVQLTPSIPFAQNKFYNNVLSSII